MERRVQGVGLHTGNGYFARLPVRGSLMNAVPAFKFSTYLGAALVLCFCAILINVLDRLIATLSELSCLGSLQTKRIIEAKSLKQNLCYTDFNFPVCSFFYTPAALHKNFNPRASRLQHD